MAYLGMISVYNFAGRVNAFFHCIHAIQKRCATLPFWSTANALHSIFLFRVSPPYVPSLRSGSRVLAQPSFCPSVPSFFQPSYV